MYTCILFSCHMEFQLMWKNERSAAMNNNEIFQISQGVLRIK